MASKRDFPFSIKDVVYLMGLRIRRPMGDHGVYTDCPFCGDARGKLNVNYEKDVFRCNYCEAHGGMLDLYATAHHCDTSTAYRDICEALNTGVKSAAFETAKVRPKRPAVPQATLAGPQQLHQTMKLLLGMLTLRHKDNLLARGLTSEQITEQEYKSTPSYKDCIAITQRLIDMGCTVQGVPGFYIDKGGRWTVNFTTRMAGFLIPVRGMDGLIRGAQIRLDTSWDDGAKYVWLSSSGKRMGVTSGSPIHFIGNPYARTVYLTEGGLKGTVAYYLMKRTFICTAGVNNLSELDALLAQLALNGTKLIMECNDIDKYRNDMVKKGSNAVYATARKYGMDVRRLTWNPNHKGVDEWQLHLRQMAEAKKQEKAMNFKQRFLYGHCGFNAIREAVESWHTGNGKGTDLREYLGLTEHEYLIFSRDSDHDLETILLAQQCRQRYRVYQLEVSMDAETIPFAFADIEVMYKKGFTQPPAAKYRLVCESLLLCPTTLGAQEVLGCIKKRYGDSLPEGFCGRYVAPSDIIELYNKDERRYFYCNARDFARVDFSPLLSLPKISSM